MAKASDQPAPPAGGLEGLRRSVATGERGRPPIHLWNPPFCGNIDMRIAADGTWFYLGSPIGRPALVRMFSSVLRREGEGYVLVTPVEKVGIKVDDAPFLGVELSVEGSQEQPVLRIRTNVDEWVAVDAEHPLRFDPDTAGSLRPYAKVRDDLWALLRRPVFYELVERGEVRNVDGIAMFGVASSGVFFAMAPAEAIGAL